MVGAFPEELVTRFRTLSLERIGRIESLWNALAQGADDEEAVRAISRDLHTLKGDAKVVGFDEVHALAQKLEELLALATHHDFRISEDFELVVSMAMQFASMLLKKKSSSASGIDLAGFLRQVDDVLRETRVLRKTRPTTPGYAPRVADAADRLSIGTRGRLAVAATDAFLEYLSARQHSRARLHGIWKTLSTELSRLQIIELAPLIERQRLAASALAGELGKVIEVVIEVGSARLDPRVAEAVEMAMVHLVRNAIDHGIERPAERGDKPRTGRIAIRGEELVGYIQIMIEDDGAGVDLDAVRHRAGAGASERELLDVLFQPGFTTRAAVGDVSGRGIGLDAVKAGLAKVGGRVSVRSQRGRGTTFTLVVPAPTRQLRVFQFLSPGGSVNLAVSARWTPTVEPSTPATIDPIRVMELSVHSRQTLPNINMPRPEQLAVRLRWGLLEIPIKISTEPVLATAERVCPTPDDHPIEVILIDGVEALLLRPEHMAAFKPAR